jgi:hypothetical protein
VGLGGGDGVWEGVGVAVGCGDGDGVALGVGAAVAPGGVPAGCGDGENDAGEDRRGAGDEGCHDGSVDEDGGENGWLLCTGGGVGRGG